MHYKACAQILADSWGPGNFSLPVFPSTSAASLSFLLNLRFSFLLQHCLFFHSPPVAVFFFSIRSVHLYLTCTVLFLVLCLVQLPGYSSEFVSPSLECNLCLLCFLSTRLDEGITFCCKYSTCWDLILCWASMKYSDIKQNRPHQKKMKVFKEKLC